MPVECAIDVVCGRNGRVPVAALRAMVADGQIAPTVRVYQSELNRMQATADPMTRLRMIEDMLERDAMPAMDAAPMIPPYARAHTRGG